MSHPSFPSAPDDADRTDAVLHSLPAAVVLLDAGGRVTGWNAQAEAWFGMAAPQVLGRPVDGLELPGAAEWLPLLHGVLAGGPGGRAGPVALPGEERRVELHLAPLAGEGGGAVLAAHDVSAAERARRVAEGLCDTAVALSSTLSPGEIFAIVCDGARGLLEADFAAVELPVLEGGRQWCAEPPPALAAELPRLLRRAWDEDRPLVVGAAAPDEVDAEQVAWGGAGAALVLPLHPDGGALALGWRGDAPDAALAWSAAGRLAAQAGAAFHNAALHAALKETTVRRDRFFSAMSHDLRTPITAIVGYSELLQDGIVGELEERQLEMVERISQVAGHLSQLVNDILDLARLDAGRMEFHRETVSLGDLVEEAVVTVEPQAQSKSLVLRRELDGQGGATLWVDRPRVRQILVNLLSNAVKFTQSGEVCITMGIDDVRGWIEVRDTGPGLPPGSEEAIFEEFLQLAAGNQSKREPGTGLGLSISRRLARAMGGDLSARSDHPGQGAAFTLFLPRETG